MDGGYNNTVRRHGAQRGIHVEVVTRPAAKGFHVLARRWVVERTLGWLMQHRPANPSTPTSSKTIA